MLTSAHIKNARRQAELDSIAAEFSQVSKGALALIATRKLRLPAHLSTI